MERGLVRTDRADLVCGDGAARELVARLVRLDRLPLPVLHAGLRHVHRGAEALARLEAAAAVVAVREEDRVHVLDLPGYIEGVDQHA